MKKILRYTLYFFVTLVAIIVVFALFTIAPVDRTPVGEMPLYKTMMSRIDSLKSATNFSSDTSSYNVGYARANLTPPFGVATAGYGKRRGKLATGIHDSLFVKTLVIVKGSQKIAIVSPDLLILPPEVNRQLSDKLNDIGFSADNVYLGATHTHNGIGNWTKGITSLLYGRYEERVVDFIVDAILESIRSASASTVRSEIFFGDVDVAGAVKNRVDIASPEDPLLRGIEFRREDRKKLLLTSFAAHATCVKSGDVVLSGDYPAELSQRLESSGYAFTMYMAGAVGSHGCHAPVGGWECVDWMADTLSNTWLHSEEGMVRVERNSFGMARVSLEMPDPQFKLTESWRFRSWFFRSALGEYPSYLTMLRIGNLVLLGAPCDFSGEYSGDISTAASKSQLTAMATSFNGGYTGYATPAKYFDKDHYETRLMNWYPPGYGDYLRDCMVRLIEPLPAD